MGKYKCTLCGNETDNGIINYTGKPVCIHCSKTIASDLIKFHIIMQNRGIEMNNLPEQEYIHIKVRIGNLISRDVFPTKVIRNKDIPTFNNKLDEVINYIEFVIKECFNPSTQANPKDAGFVDGECQVCGNDIHGCKCVWEEKPIV